jgi:hypothetical protein
MRWINTFTDFLVNESIERTLPDRFRELVGDHENGIALDVEYGDRESLTEIEEELAREFPEFEKIEVDADARISTGDSQKIFVSVKGFLTKSAIVDGEPQAYEEVSFEHGGDRDESGPWANEMPEPPAI